VTIQLHPGDVDAAHSAVREATGSPLWQKLLVALAGGLGAALVGAGAWLRAKAQRLNRRIDRQSIVPHDPTPAAALRTNPDEIREAVLDERTDQRIKVLEREQAETRAELQAYFRRHDVESRRLQRMRGRITGLQSSTAAQASETRILNAINAVGLAHERSMREHVEKHHSKKGE